MPSKSTRRGDSSNSRMTTDHDEIRRWAESRGGKPAVVRDTAGKSGAGVLRIDFPGYSGGDTLEPIPWEDFFRTFDERQLALVYQERTKAGRTSRFARIVARDARRS
jgi:hypothetical protein